MLFKIYHTDSTKGFLNEATIRRPERNKECVRGGGCDNHPGRHSNAPAHHNIITAFVVVMFREEETLKSSKAQFGEKN